MKKLLETWKTSFETVLFILYDTVFTKMFLDISFTDKWQNVAYTGWNLFLMWLGKSVEIDIMRLQWRVVWVIWLVFSISEFSYVSQVWSNFVEETMPSRCMSHCSSILNDVCKPIESKVEAFTTVLKPFGTSISIWSWLSNITPALAKGRYETMKNILSLIKI